MRNRAVPFLLLLLFLGSASLPVEGRKKDHVIGFYNVENLFDTAHDEGKNDNDYLPEGRYSWTQDKYESKLSNIATVIRDMKERNKVWHTVLGLAEVENDRVLEDLVARPEIASAKFSFIHFEGPDRRGIDVAMLYRPDRFTLLEAKPIPFDFESVIDFEYSPEEQYAFRTREVLMARGLIDGEMFAIYVAHTPSRVGAKGGDLRGRSCEIIRKDAEALMMKYPGIKVVVMGDMNDNPGDESQVRYLHARETIEETGPRDFFSPFISMHKAGLGTEEYRGEWNIFDIIEVNRALCDAPKGSLVITPSGEDGFYGNIFTMPYMIQDNGQYAGTPKRTFSGGQFIDGYSDHYPTYIIISRKRDK